MTKKKMRGSFTIETALLFPILMFLIISLIYLCFYLHHNAYLKVSAYEAAIDGVIFGVRKQAQQNTAIVQSKACERADVITWGTKGITKDVSVTEQSIQVQYGCEIYAVYGGFRKDISVQAQLKVIKPVKTIRTYMELKNLNKNEGA